MKNSWLQKLNAFIGTPVWNWLVEFYKRLGGRTPSFFVVISNLGAIAALIGSLPDILEFLNLHVPARWQYHWEMFLKIAGVVAFVIARLPDQRTSVAVDNHGGTTNVLKIADPDKLPFTVASEEKKAKKLVLPEVDVAEINPAVTIMAMS